MRITWSVTQCELGEFVFGGEGAGVNAQDVYVCMGVVRLHNQAIVMMFNRKLKISWIAKEIFTPQNC